MTINFLSCLFYGQEAVSVAPMFTDNRFPSISQVWIAVSEIDTFCDHSNDVACTRLLWWAGLHGVRTFSNIWYRWTAWESLARFIFFVTQFSLRLRSKLSPLNRHLFTFPVIKWALAIEFRSFKNTNDTSGPQEPESDMKRTLARISTSPLPNSLVAPVS